jgi:hypothetical protein
MDLEDKYKYQKKYYINNKEKIKEYQREYMKEYQRRYREEHREEYNLRHNIYYHERKRKNKPVREKYKESIMVYL